MLRFLAFLAFLDTASSIYVTAFLPTLTSRLLSKQFWKPLAPFFAATAITYYGVSKMQDMGVNSERTAEAMESPSASMLIIFCFFVSSSGCSC